MSNPLKCILLVEAGIVPESRLSPLLDETGQLTAIFVTIIKRAKERKKDE